MMPAASNQSFADEHEAFAASRVSQYVYVPTRDHFFQTLDQHADTLEADVKPPLVLLGNEGSGKSALLANWVAKRREHRHRDEFLFQHFVGCTIPSMQLAHTLFRLETALKDFYQLREMKVPDTEEELRWSLNRFLAAAAKKHSPARIIIIIDGINKLKAEGAPDGALHWLPTELPPCVRFFVSTVEFDRALSKELDQPLHRTFVELNRRQCPFLRIEPLSVPTRHSVIQSFISLTSQGPDMLELSDSQQFKVVTAPVTSQPMFLRSLLQALRATSSLTSIPMDQLLETFLSCNSAHELIEKQLDICCEEISTTSANGAENAEVLGKILSMVYVSRNGLTEAEIRAMIKMFSKYQPDEIMCAKLFSIFEAFTMVVNNNHSFSHEIYREVIYLKYICSQDKLTRWHYLMARYFGQLPPCDRKLEALPHHLEMAGSWSKVKNCLTDIEMFRLWWTPKFKGEFIKFWASLTRQTGAEKKEEIYLAKKVSAKKGAGGHNSGHDAHGADAGHDSSSKNRPTYDIVEEYVKSLDEYRTLKHPSDEQIADIVLGISDFLLEFAVLGHEANADVPALVHPMLPTEDLRALGVPHLVTDEEGKTTLSYPSIFPSFSPNAEEGGGAAEAPAKVGDVPVDVTTYFFNRWMWIHFAYVALGNCDARYNEGISKMDEREAGFDTLKYTTQSAKTKKARPEDKDSLRSSKDNAAFGLASFKLPEIKFVRKAAKSVRRLTKHDTEDVTMDKLTIRLTALQEDILSYKEELDFASNMKGVLKRREQDLAGQLEELKRIGESMNIFDDQLANTIKKEKDASGRFEAAKTLHKNLSRVFLLCRRHPANVPALIDELNNKLEQDIYLIKEIKNRLWEQKFERQSHAVNFRDMKTLVQEGADMHNKLLDYRYSMKKTLAKQQIEDQKKLDMRLASMQITNVTKKTRRDSYIGGNGSIGGENSTLQLSRTGADGKGMSWDEMWAIISSRTGITEPDIFFQRLNNGGALEEQINTLKKASEQRLEYLKKEQVAVEAEMEEVRYQASFGAGPSNKDKFKELAEKQQAQRHIKEKSEAAQELVQKIESGLSHIADLLGVEKREEDQTSSVGDLLRDIETALDTVIDEREKQQQQLAGQAQSQAQANMSQPALLSIPGTESLRSPFSRMQTPVYKANVPHLEMGFDVTKSFAKPRGTRKKSKSADQGFKSSKASPRDSDDEDNVELADRAYIKAVSLKSLKDAERRAAIQAKKIADAQAIAMK